MKIRLHGTADECRETLELLDSVLLVQSAPQPGALFSAGGDAGW